MCRITIAQFSCKCYIHPDLWNIKSNRGTVALETNRFLEKIRVGDIALKELTPAFITDFDIFLRTEKQCCNNTAWIYTMPLRRMIAIALNRGWIVRDPFVDYSISAESADRDYLTRDEFRRKSMELGVITSIFLSVLMLRFVQMYLQSKYSKAAFPLLRTCGFDMDGSDRMSGQKSSRRKLK